MEATGADEGIEAMEATSATVKDYGGSATPALRRLDPSCRITDYLAGIQVVHLCPSKEITWFEKITYNNYLISQVRLLIRRLILIPSGSTNSCETSQDSRNLTNA